MKKSTRIYFLILALVGMLSCVSENESKPISQMSKKVSFNDNWNFSLDSTFLERTVVNVPHTPKIEPLVVNNQWQGTMWYQKDFDNTFEDNERVFFKFEGVMHEADVWLNETHVAHHLGGYLPFSIDVSKHLKNGKNSIKLKVTNTDNAVIPPGKPLKDLDFNYYGGIYRDVTLITKNEVYISDPMLADKIGGGGILAHFSEVSNTSAKCDVKIHAVNTSDKEKEVFALVVLKDDTGKVITQKSKVLSIRERQDIEFSISLTIDNPKLWNTITPNLYSLTTKLYSDDAVVDSVTETVGIRKIELNEKGFFLNDKKMYISGTNRHQEYPYVGYAISNQANYRDAVKIKEAGFDFVRLSHYPQDKAFLNACDELGLLVMNAIPGWQFYQEGDFVTNSYQDIRDLVRRDRNHASVVFWENSLNESGMTEAYMTKANEILKEELPFPDTYSAGWIDYPSFDLYIPARQHGKAPNFWNNYDKNGRKVLIAEYGDWEYYAQNAGFSQKEFKNLKEEERTSRQLREHGEKRLLQQALNFQEGTNSNRKGEHTIGDANWLMFDYNRGYADDLEASGISDIFRNPKFANYFYQSQRPASESIKFKSENIGGAMVKIASYWNDDSSTDVKVYSNCDEVALFLNGKMIAKKKGTSDNYATHLVNPPFIFSVGQFMPGELVAKGFLNGAEVVSDIVKTAGEASKIALSIDTSGIDIGKDDIVVLNASILDAVGNFVSKDNSTKVFFEIENGAAVLIGENPSISKAGIASILIKVIDTTKTWSVVANNRQLKGSTLYVAPKNLLK